MQPRKFNARDKMRLQDHLPGWQGERGYELTCHSLEKQRRAKPWERKMYTIHDRL